MVTDLEKGHKRSIMPGVVTDFEKGHKRGIRPQTFNEARCGYRLGIRPQTSKKATNVQQGHKRRNFSSAAFFPAEVHEINMS